MQFATLLAFVAAVAAVAVRDEGCPANTNEVSNQPGTCCVYSYTYDECCVLGSASSAMGFRTCDQFVKDGANNFDKN